MVFYHETFCSVWSWSIIIYIFGVKLILFNDGCVDYKEYKSSSWKTDFLCKRKPISLTVICKHVISILAVFLYN